MKADISDAPERVSRKHHTPHHFYLLISLVIGSIATGGGFMFINRIPHFALADKQAVSPFVSDGSIVRGSDTLPKQGAGESWLRASSETDVPASGARQTVYNDQNYRPRGADNVVNFPVQADPAPRKETPKPVKLTIVRQSVSMKERVCWPYRQGSIEARNCRAAVGLKYRD